MRTSGSGADDGCGNSGTGATLPSTAGWAAGFDWSHVVDGVVYLPDMTKFPDMNAAYREVFAKDFPARATVGTGLMGADAAVEIMFTAVR